MCNLLIRDPDMIASSQIDLINSTKLASPLVKTHPWIAACELMDRTDYRQTYSPSVGRVNEEVYDEYTYL